MIMETSSDMYNFFSGCEKSRNKLKTSKCIAILMECQLTMGVTPFNLPNFLELILLPELCLVTLDAVKLMVEFHS